MAVIDEVYLVGQIIEVNYSNSRALLLSDLNSKIPSVLEPDDIQAVVSGTGDSFGTIEHTQIDYKELFNNQEIIFTQLSCVKSEKKLIFPSDILLIFPIGIPGLNKPPRPEV